MLGRSTGALLVGVDARLVHVEVDLGGGLPTIAAVGLPDSAVREGIDRIRSALRHAGFKLPQRRVTINLAPAELRKHGSSLDLPIAAALLMADGQIPRFDTRKVVLVGELGLDGSVRAIRGALSVAAAARATGRLGVLVPRENADEAALLRGISVVALETLADLASYAAGSAPAWPRRDALRRLGDARSGDPAPELSDVRGQAAARRALEIAAAGGHHLLMSGSPGSGKTMLARRLPGILPPLSVEEALDVTRVWSAAGLARDLVIRRPFRAPHHGVSIAGMTGGGPRLRPGEMSLAHRGVLFLDEMSEFRRDALDSLRQPLEEGRIRLVRIHASACFPARFTLVASMNPCPCGYHGVGEERCRCTPAEIRRYGARVSGPLRDRFDLTVHVPPVRLDAMAGTKPCESSEEVRGRVLAARARQRERFGPDGPACNAGMEPADLNRCVQLDAAGRRILVSACERLGLSARGYDRARRVARTIADLEGGERVTPRHVAEAVQYRHPGLR